MKPRERNFVTTPLCFIICFVFAAALLFVVQYLEACSSWAQKNIDFLQKEAARLKQRIQQFDSLM